MSTAAETTTAQPVARGTEVLAVAGLVKQFGTGRTLLDRLAGRPATLFAAVDGVDLTVHAGETVGLVGESGCGKSTLARCAMALYEPTAGEVRYGGVALDGRPSAQLRRTVQMVFQDPYSSLNPRMTVGQVLRELLRHHHVVPRAEVDVRAKELVDLVGLPQRALDQHPRQFSGGQRQRIGIARALALEPKVLIADEAVSALDVSVQATIINLLTELQQTLGLSMLFVSHNMAVVRQVSDRIAVMYQGRVVETGPTATVFDHPSHPYTQLLLSSVPRMLTSEHQRTIEPVAAAPVATGTATPGGCRFLPRCPVSTPACAAEPGLRAVSGRAGTFAACVHVPDRAAA